MSDLLKTMSTLSAAEEFLDYFQIPYDQPVINVNRLHILKRFNQYLRATPGTAEMDDDTLRSVCRDALGKAYSDFVSSTPAQEKVFKVFQDTDGKQHISLDSMRSALPSR
ncbi:nitrogenase stabilizing/protective protein NifW [Thiobacillus sp.]|uniref:nitrogenase stabilizing/protective protein NifW n=1 Tax=Thiobacillus sp. TaxID=924 RepID=UPI00286E83F1|nr:nitrogenase stabilizing/protective protein NifW [Thiobacillus sp.]